MRWELQKIEIVTYSFPPFWKLQYQYSDIYIKFVDDLMVVVMIWANIKQA